MSIRVTGLVSGLDTDSIVQELVSAYATKKNNYVKKQTTLEWQMDAWKELNTKVNALYKKIGNLKLSSAYNKKTTSCSDTTKATVTASSSAVNGTQTLEINQVAKTAYITGAKLDSSVTSSTKLSELGLEGEGTIAVTTKSGTTNVAISDSMTVNDVVSALKDAGVSASYDSTNKRFFVSGKDTGVDYDFSLTGTDENGVKALQELGIYVNKDANTAAYQKWTEADYVAYNADGTIDETTTRDNLTSILEKIATYQGDEDTEDSIAKLQQDSANRKTENTNLQNKVNYANAYSGLKEALAAEYEVTDEDGNVTATNSLTEDEQTELWDLMTSRTDLSDEQQERLDELKEKLGADDTTWSTMESNASTVETFDTYLLNDTLTSDERDELEAVQSTVRAAYATGNGAEDIAAYTEPLEAQITANNEAITANTEEIAEKNAYISSYTLLTDAVPDSVGDISTRVDALMDKINFAATQLDSSTAAAYSSGAVVVEAQDAVITLNGAEYTSSSNNITVNGLTITALQTTNGEELTVTTATDVQGIYDTIKGFLTDYNALIKEMDQLYNADSAKGYEPLTDDEKEAMTDTEIEKWETKIKDSILRGDDTLSSVMNLMTTAMYKSVTMSNGKSYSLATFGIATQGYFASADNEQYVYHIDGDPDDTVTSGNKDKLMAAIQNDPDSVVEFFQGLMGNFYDSLTDKMGHSTTTHSIYTIYNDKTMQNEYEDYDDQIESWEEKLSALEDYYYSKFAAMETALANLQSQQSSLSSLLGS